MDDLIKDEQGLIKTGQYTAVNPKYASAQGLEAAANFSGIPNTITSSDLAGNPKPYTIPKTQTPTTAAGLSGLATSVSESTKEANALQAEQEAKLAEAESQKQSTRSRLEGLFGGIKDVLSSRATEEEAAGIAQKTQKVTDVSNQIDALDRAELNEIRALDNQPITLQDKQQRINDIQRQYAFQKADLALIQSAANKDLATAQSIVDRKIQMALEPLQLEYDFVKDFYEENKADFDEEDQRAFEFKIQELETARNQEQQLQETIGSLQLSAAQQGADISIIQAIGRAKTLTEAIQAAGVYGGDILARKKNLLEIQKLQNEVDMGKPLTGEYGSIVNTAAALVPATKSKQVKQNLTQALGNQDYTTAYAEIANSVEDGLTGTNKTRFSAARTDIAVMSGMRDAIQQFADAGGDMGYLKGTADQIAKRFGQLATNPKFASLAIQLEREFQAYRNEMTGAAFTPEESNEYRAVNPRGNAQLDLNLATIDGAIAQLSNRVKSTIDTRVPGSGKIYDLVFSKADEVNNSTPVGDVQVVNGVKYIKSGDGLYYPESQTKSSTNTSTPVYTSENITPNFNSFGSLFNFK